jgi:hypothetical protein
VAKEVVAERFGPNKKVQKDMLGSFIAHGLKQEEAGSESLLQMLVLFTLYLSISNTSYPDSLAPTQPPPPSALPSST